MRGYNDVAVGECSRSSFFIFRPFVAHFSSYFIDFIFKTIDIGSVLLDTLYVFLIHERASLS